MPSCIALSDSGPPWPLTKAKMGLLWRLANFICVASARESLTVDPGGVGSRTDSLRDVIFGLDFDDTANVRSVVSLPSLRGRVKRRIAWDYNRRIFGKVGFEVLENMGRSSGGKRRGKILKELCNGKSAKHPSCDCYNASA